MRRIILLIIFLSTFTTAINVIIPSQTIYAGDNLELNIILDNEQPVFGLSLKLTEQPNSNITFLNATPTDRLYYGYNGATENNPDKITLYSVYPGTSIGISPGNSTIFTLTYQVPETTTGTYQLIPELSATNENGQTLNATINTPTITVQEAPLAQLVLPNVNLNIGEEKEISICLTNRHPTTPITELQFDITYNSNIIEVVQTNLGTSTLETGKTTIQLTNISVLNTDCSQNTGTLGTIKIKGKNAGTTPLSFQNYGTSVFSIESLGASNGQASVSGSSSSNSGTGGGKTGSYMCPTYCLEQKYQNYPACQRPECEGLQKNDKVKTAMDMTSVQDIITETNQILPSQTQHTEPKIETPTSQPEPKLVKTETPEPENQTAEEESKKITVSQKTRLMIISTALLMVLSAMILIKLKEKRTNALKRSAPKEQLHNPEANDKH